MCGAHPRLRGKRLLKRAIGGCAFIRPVAASTLVSTNAVNGSAAPHLAARSGRISPGAPGFGVVAPAVGVGWLARARLDEPPAAAATACRMSVAALSTAVTPGAGRECRLGGSPLTAWSAESRAALMLRQKNASGGGDTVDVISPQRQYYANSAQSV